MPEREQAADDDQRSSPVPWSLRGLLARIARNTTPKPRKRPDDKTGRREVRGD